MKTGEKKFETLVKAYVGKKLGIDRIRKYTGLSEKSICMYTSWNQYGSFHSGMLNVSRMCFGI